MDGIDRATGEVGVFLIGTSLREGKVVEVIANSTGIGQQELRADAPSVQFQDEDFVTQLRRIADHFDPPSLNIVGTPYVAQKLGCTTVWVTQMIHLGQIPIGCIVPGTGNGKPWKFHRRHIDEWIKRR